MFCKFKTIKNEQTNPEQREGTAYISLYTFIKLLIMMLVNKGCGYWIPSLSLLLLLIDPSDGGAINHMQLDGPQTDQLAKFKEDVKSSLTADWMQQDDFLVRYLRAKDWKTPEAKTMLLAMLAWRKENKIDSIHSEDWTGGFEKIKVVLGGVSKSGTLILRLNIKDLDLTLFLDKLDKFKRFIYRMLDAAQLELYNTRNDNGTLNTTAYTCLYNLKGYDLKKHACVGVGLAIPPHSVTCLKLYTEMVRVMEYYYLELCDDIIWHQVPKGFTEISQPVVAVMSVKTKDRIRFIKEGGLAREELQKYIDFDQLPYELGGEKGKEDLSPKRTKKQPWDAVFWGRK